MISGAKGEDAMRRYDPQCDRRRSLRLKGYDYGQVGAYFVTICTNERVSLFGDVVAGTVVLNAAGRIGDDEWLRTSAVRPNAGLDSYVVMPNHVHAVAIIRQPTATAGGRRPPAVPQSPTQTLGALVRGFKGACARRLVEECRLTAPIWQRNYHEHVVRDEPDLARIRAYIAQNPERWMAAGVTDTVGSSGAL